MAEEFEYSNDDGPDIETIRSIAAEMAGDHKPRPPTDAERQEHERWLAERQQADELRQLEYRRRQEEIANKERIEGERQAAIARAQASERERLAFQERTRLRERDTTLTGILNQQIEQRAFRQAAVRSAAHAAARQRLSSALDNAIALKYPPPPPEPPTVIVEQQDDEIAARWHRSWFK